MKYLVVETEYEYNDEYYHPTEDESYSIASKLYSTREEAEKVAQQLNETKGFDGYVQDKSTDWDTEHTRIEPYKVVPVEE